ncbi:MAG: P1 family peptidase, partial [Pseudomonadota bacterium]
QQGNRSPSLGSASKTARAKARAMAVDAACSKLTWSGATRLAVAGQVGLARAIYPAHTAFDGDLVFGVSTGRGTALSAPDQVSLEHAASTAMARALARAVFEAEPRDGDLLPCWSEIR